MLIPSRSKGSNLSPRAEQAARGIASLGMGTRFVGEGTALAREGMESPVLLRGARPGVRTRDVLMLLRGARQGDKAISLFVSDRWNKGISLR